MRLTLGELKEILREAASVPPSGGWFHISLNDLGDTFKFTPRLPSDPYIDDDQLPIEDAHTKRTSWAPSIDKAIEALQGLVSPTSRRPAFVYYVRSLPGEVDLSVEFDGCPSSPGNEYGTDFMLKPWLDYMGRITGRRPSQDRVEDEFTGCVPDAKDTQERWATRPVVARRIGVLKKGKFISS